MNLNVLVSHEQAQTGLSGQRHAAARDLLRQGMSALHAAVADGFRQRALLVEACSSLLEAIRHNRSDPDAFVALGYLLWLTGEHAESQIYLSEALSLDPGNSDAQQLSQLNLRALSKPRPAEALLAAEALLMSEDDFDGRYDLLEKRIAAEVKRLSGRKPDWFAVTDDRFRLERMQRQLKGLVQTRDDLCAELDEIAAEIACEALESMLKPLESFIVRAGEIVTRSLRLIELQEGIDLHNSWLERVLRLSRGALPADFTQERFEALLDDCDRLADSLDALEQAGEKVAGLIAAYELMIARVDQLHELADGISN